MQNSEWLKLRNKLVDKDKKMLRLSILSNSKESKDFKFKENCNGLGRIRHFKEFKIEKWISDPLPMFPAAKVLKCDVKDARLAQVFQIAGCNYRCWFCFVDFDLLSADETKSKMIPIRDLIKTYLELTDRPLVLDLSGGNPGLVPEWILWTLKEIDYFGAGKKTYVWADDNLSVDYFSKFLSKDDLSYISTHKSYGSVACFKGFDEESYQFNTGINGFSNQFKIFHRYFSFGWDIYAYVTFTTPSIDNLKDRINKFVDNLQSIDINLPLRTIPLEIKIYTPTSSRINDLRQQSIYSQYKVLKYWIQCLSERYDKDLTEKNICDVPFIKRKDHYVC